MSILVLTFYISLFIILIASYTVAQKSLKVKEISLYLILGVLLNSHFFIVLWEMNLFDPSQVVIHHATYIFLKTAITPLILAFSVNYYVKLHTVHSKIAFIMFLYGSLLVLEVINVSVPLYSYKIWSSHSTVLFHSGLFALFLLTHHIFSRRKGTHNDIHSIH